MAALYGVVRISQRLLGVAAGEGHRLAMLWTGIAIWLEPLRSTFDYGQINVVLALATLGAVFSTRWWLSGLLLGTAAGVKLTPAIGGLYFVGARRWGTAVFSAVVFLATIAVSALVVGDQTRYYFTDLIFKTDRVGPICTIFNQSWRGGICRIFGHDAGYSPVVLIGIAVTAILSVLAWRALSARSTGPARPAAGGRTVRAAALADFLDPPLGVAGAVDDLAAARPAVRPSRRADPRLELAGADHHRRALAAELRPADHLAERQAVVSGLGRAGLHRGDVGDAGLDRGQRNARGYSAMIPSMSRAISTSFSVMPPSECVTSAKVTVRQRISMSG